MDISVLRYRSHAGMVSLRPREMLISRGAVFLDAAGLIVLSALSRQLGEDFQLSGLHFYVLL